MTILWITENYYPNKGGMAQSCDRIVSGLREQNIRIDVVHLARKCRRRPGGNPITGEDHCWPLDDSPSHGLNLLWNWIEAKDTHYSAVVAYGTHYALIAAKNYASWLAIPLIAMVRGNDFDAAVFDYRRRGLIEDVYRASKKVICVSQDKVKKIRALYPDVDAVWVPNGIDLNQWRIFRGFREQAENFRNEVSCDKRIIGLIGDLKAKKGGEFFLNTLLLSGLSEQLHILLVGSLDEKLEACLQENQARIHYTHVPFVERHQLISYYLACDCIAIPSFYDGMPNVLLEAGGLGIPILASDTGGMRDILRHAENSLLFPPGDTHSLREMLEHVAHDNIEQLKALGEKGQELIRSEYTHTREAMAYRDIFTSLISIG